MMTNDRQGEVGVRGRGFARGGGGPRHHANYGQHLPPPQGAPMHEEKVFRSSDNPHFPKEDRAFSVIDRRGDVNARDYDYVEFNAEDKDERRHGGHSRRPPKDMTFAGDISGEVQQQQQNQPQFQNQQRTPLKQEETNAPWFRPRFPLRRPHHPNDDYLSYRVEGPTSQEQKEDPELHFNPFMGALPRGNLRNDTRELLFPALYPEMLMPLKRRRRRRMNVHHQPEEQHRRVRREILGPDTSFVEDVHSLFQDIKENYPQMLQWLNDEHHQLPMPEFARDFHRPEHHVENLFQPHGGHEEMRIVDRLDGTWPLRRTRSTGTSSNAKLGFDRNDPQVNEIGYKLPTLPPTTPALADIVPTAKPQEETVLASIVSGFWERWHTLQQELKRIFW